jgi:hypothetical protein
VAQLKTTSFATGQMSPAKPEPVYAMFKSEHDRLQKWIKRCKAEKRLQFLLSTSGTAFGVGIASTVGFLTTAYASDKHASWLGPLFLVMGIASFLWAAATRKTKDQEETSLDHLLSDMKDELDNIKARHDKETGGGD